MYIYNLFHVIHWPYRVIFTNLQKGNVVICFIYISMFLVQQHLIHIFLSVFSSWRDPKPKALLCYSAGHHRMGSVFLVVYNRKGKVSSFMFSILLKFLSHRYGVILYQYVIMAVKFIPTQLILVLKTKCILNIEPRPMLQHPLRHCTHCYTLAGCTAEFLHNVKIRSPPALVKRSQL